MDSNDKENLGYWYRADGEMKDALGTIDKWKPSIFMPKDACRTFLKVADVRVERLHDISPLDSVKEGIKPTSIVDDPIACKYENYMSKEKGALYPTHSFFSLWQSINGKESLESNPFVWAYSFEKIEKPSDFK